MKTTRLTTYWDTDQVITIIDLLDELRLALIDTYYDEIEDFQQQRSIEQQKEKDNLDLFDDDIDF